MIDPKHKLSVSLEMEFDTTTDGFGNFCKMLIDNGYRHVVEAMAQKLLEEARRRNLPIVAELEKVVTS